MWTKPKSFNLLYLLLLLLLLLEKLDCIACHNINETLLSMMHQLSWWKVSHHDDQSMYQTFQIMLLSCRWPNLRTIVFYVPFSLVYATMADNMETFWGLAWGRLQASLMEECYGLFSESVDSPLET